MPVATAMAESQVGSIVWGSIWLPFRRTASTPVWTVRVSALPSGPRSQPNLISLLLTVTSRRWSSHRLVEWAVNGLS
jgi:hypothetical protein